MIEAINQQLRYALDEDCPNGDITCECLNLSKSEGIATITAKESGVFFGKIIFDMLCPLVNKKIKFHLFLKDGDQFETGTIVATLQGPFYALLHLERTLLNYIQRLSGIATLSRRYVDALNAPHIKVLDTRKTTPGLRILEKKAVVAGRAYNHRHHLSDMVLIKENHLHAFASENPTQSLGEQLATFKKKHPHIPIEIEVETFHDIDTLPLIAADIVMLDNFDRKHIPDAVKKIKQHNPKCDIEISGGITLETIHTYASFPIQRISVGALTHSVPSIDLSMRCEQRTI